MLKVANAASCPQTLDMGYTSKDQELQNLAKPGLQKFTKQSDQLYKGDDGKHFWSRCPAGGTVWNLSDKQDCSGKAKMVFESSFGNCWDNGGTLFVMEPQEGFERKTTITPITGLQPFQQPTFGGGGGGQFPGRRPGGRQPGQGNQTPPPPSTTPFPVATDPSVQKNGDGSKFQKILIFGSIGVALLLLALVAIMCIPCAGK